MCAVTAAPGPAGIRVWEVMSRGRGPRVGCPPPEGVDVAYPPAGQHSSGSGARLSFEDRVRFDLHHHVRIDQTRDLDHRACWPDLLEDLAVSAAIFVPA
jgi:hypothetical protein